MFLRTKAHRNPADILKSFIRAASTGSTNATLSDSEETTLRSVFAFVRKLYVRDAEFRASRLAVNQIHFYTMITTIIGEDLLVNYPLDELGKKLKKFAAILEGRTGAPSSLRSDLKLYRELSEKQTTHTGRRQSRQTIFKKVIEAL
jgi:hypothetical protein